jgi:NAD(P)-dependent dehydrogenase (short-subunit alcohol dehydrogenase family)
MPLNNKVALITGGAVRVGKAIALELAERGVHVGFTYLNDAEPWEETLHEIRSRGVGAAAMSLDVRDGAQVRACVDHVSGRLGGIDILINNASVWLQRPFLELKLEEWEDVLSVNLTGPLLCSQAVAPLMLQRGGGTIVNIIDLSAFQTWPGFSAHTVSKAGLLALTRSMAAELAPLIRVNAVAPGTVLLPEGAGEDRQRWAVNNSLLKRIGAPEDVGKTVAFICETEFITGSIYLIDGGRSLVSAATTN